MNIQYWLITRNFWAESEVLADVYFSEKDFEEALSGFVREGLEDMAEQCEEITIPDDDDVYGLLHHYNEMRHEWVLPDMPEIEWQSETKEVEHAQ